MKPVSELYDRHLGADIYVIGTGASMRVFPSEFFEGRITIGLNQAWRHAHIRYGITIGPHLNIPEFIEGEQPRPEITWITKRDKSRAVLTPEQFAYADERFYYFEMGGRRNTQPLEEPSDEGRFLEWVRKPTAAKLYQWSSISQTGVNLAANMGAKTVILVGCDNSALADNHHAHSQHTKWLGADPERRYWQYYEGLADVRGALRCRGVNVLTLTPFLKLDAAEHDFARLCDELRQPRRVNSGPDISELDHPRRFLERTDSTRLSKLRGGIRKARSIGRRTLRRIERNG
jgi:hypothetical protein